MATLPGANNTLATGGAAAVSGADLITVIAPCASNADAVPRIFGSPSAIYAQHGYCEGVEYCALHANGTNKPCLFVGIPIATPGVVGRVNTGGNTGTSVISVTAGGSGVLAEHDGVVRVIAGGTVGTDQIVLGLSMDGGTSERRVRLGTATSYVIPYFNVTLSATVGTLVAGDTIITWHGTGPLGDSAGWTSAYASLAAGQRTARSKLIVGDLPSDTEASALLALEGAYETTYDRFEQIRASVIDRLPLATMSATSHRMSAVNVTFAEVGAMGDTIVRASGSWATDGFATGDIVTIAGSASNNKTTAAVVTVTNATTITLGADDLVDEGPVANVTITGEPSLTFSDAADTIVRAGGSCGSWLDDGFRVGDVITVSGTVSNDGTYTVTDVTALTLTLESDDLANEVIGITVPTISAGQTKAAWMAAITAEFAPIDANQRIDLSAGKARVYSTFSGWYLRWPAAWAASVREYAHDLHTPTWRKADGPTGWSLFDSDGTLVEWDDRVDGGAASAARFTSFRTWANGPVGAFLANSLTRASDASMLVQTHNNAVVNRARAVCQAATEDAVGRSLKKKADGTATTASLAEIESFVNGSLANDMLTNKMGEGPRASNVTWVAATDDNFSVPEPILNGTLTVDLNGTIHTVNTVTVVR